MMDINLNRIYQWPLLFRVMVMITVALLVFGLLYYFDISGLNSQLEQTQKEEQELKDQLVSILNKQAKDKSELIQFKPIEALLIEWQKKLINYHQLPQLMDQILKIGSTHHIDFQLFSPGSPIKENLYYKVPIKISAVGNYDALASFLSDIASLPSIAVINDFSISSELKNTPTDPKIAARMISDRLLVIDMILEVYYVAKK